jgi:hypothetical protein
LTGCRIKAAAVQSRHVMSLTRLMLFLIFHGKVPELQGILIRRYRRQGSPLVRRYRRQATHSLPILSLLLSGGTCEGSADELRATVDLGLPLVDAAAASFGVPRSVIRHMVRRPVGQFGWRWLARPRQLFGLLALLPPEHRPAGKGAWTAFSNCISWLDQWEIHPLADDIGARWLRENASLGFDNLHRSVWRYRPTVSIASPAFAGLKGFVHDLDLVARQAGVIAEKGGYGQQPDHATSGAQPVPLLRRFATAVYGTAPEFRTLLKMADGYRSESHGRSATSGRTSKLPPGIRWEPLWPHTFLYGNLRIVPLCTARELRDEGRRLHHCVGKYAEDCFSGWSRILSVRDSFGNPVSTAELSISCPVAGSPGAAIAVEQHKGLCNAPPPEEALRAVDLYVKFLERALPADRLANLFNAGAGGSDSVSPRQAAIEKYRRMLIGLDHRLPVGVTLEAII